MTQLIYYCATIIISFIIVWKLNLYNLLSTSTIDKLFRKYTKVKVYTYDNLTFFEQKDVEIICKSRIKSY